MENFLSISCSFDRFKSVEVLSLLLLQPEKHDITLNIFSIDGFFKLRKLSFSIFQLQSQGIYLLSATLIRHLLGIFKLLEFIFKFIVIFLWEDIIKFVFWFIFRMRFGCKFCLKSCNLISIRFYSLFQFLFFLLQLLSLLLQVNNFFPELHNFMIELFFFSVAVPILLLFV